MMSPNGGTCCALLPTAAAPRIDSAISAGATSRGGDIDSVCNRSGDRAGNLVRRHGAHLAACAAETQPAASDQDTNLWKSGSRFSLKAATPSFDSAVS
jgi:hypothetical protein